MSTTMTSATLEPPRAATENESRAPASALAAAIAADVLYEVVDDKIVDKEFHAHEAAVASLLCMFLGNFARTTRLGRAFILMLFRIDQPRDLQRRPDIAFVSHAKWPVHRRLPDAEAWDMVPDLAIEIVNSTELADQVQETIHDYFRAGVTRVWVVYPNQREVYIYSSLMQIQVLQLGQDLDGGELIPGFRLPLAALFKDDAE
jgi:Uma2 family endonuclease